MQSPAAFGGIAAAVAGAGAFLLRQVTGKETPAASTTAGAVSEPEIEVIDVSIPYDAAALLQYRKMKGINFAMAIDEQDFAQFKALYEEKTVADVILKKATRELAEYEAAAIEANRLYDQFVETAQKE
jgi:hypothetical protein